MLFKNISILNESFEIEENMYVGIDGEKITYISKEAPKRGFGRVYRRNREAPYEWFCKYPCPFTHGVDARIWGEYGFAGLAE